MNREELIEKWLDHNLNPAELEAFKQLEDYPSLIKLDQGLSGFKADIINEDEAFEHVLKSIDSIKKNPKKLYTTLSKIAAILIVAFGIYFYTSTLDNSASTIASQQKSIVLPDDSQVELNAMSTITFNESNWDNNRALDLKGEAFFKVAKGKKFDVNTDAGTVSVLGTQFNVKQRDQYFEVTCFEGKVAVTSTIKQITLLPGDTFLIIDGKYITTEKENLLRPSWLTKKSTFRSIPYREVIKEFERQYNVSIEFETINDSQNFTGSFTHNDIEIALKSITLPLQLKYSKTDNIIRLKRE
ncbi:MAG: ferric-dicitrate binding protein FerR (iron transport regulator) [Psychroserpens sp.]|jgi:ferric-dicitrate binding protein FerR (iron transport regulator)|uniref:FecR family protein n=1 Tax=Psychroserpens sp. TaxID=2020870 RepID=UPI0039E6C808